MLAFSACAPATLAANGGYGELIARGAGGAAGTRKAEFQHVRPARLFWLVLTDSAQARIHVSWSISCFNLARRAHGGAAGQATVARGRWVKRIRADWITQPAFCSGAVRGSAEGSSVQIHVYAE